MIYDSIEVLRHSCIGNLHGKVDASVQIFVYSALNQIVRHEHLLQYVSNISFIFTDFHILLFCCHFFTFSKLSSRSCRRSSWSWLFLNEPNINERFRNNSGYFLYLFFIFFISSQLLIRALI